MHVRAKTAKDNIPPMVREEDLKKKEETVTWLKGWDDYTYVKIHTTVYVLSRRASQGCDISHR